MLFLTQGPFTDMMMQKSDRGRGDRIEGKRLVYLVDDHLMMREGLAALINGTANLFVCGACSSAEEALQDVPRAKPDIVIIDLSLEGTSGLELIKNLHDRHPELPMLVLSMHDETFFAERSLRAGAKGYVMKHKAVRELQEAIQRVLEGGFYVSQNMSDRLLQVMSRSEGKTHAWSLELLSDREVEVFEMIGRGLGNTEIARRLHLSTKTIETYRARIKEKLDLEGATQLLQHAMSWVQGANAGTLGRNREIPPGIK